MDEGLSPAVMEVFVTLYDEGLIYRGKRLVNWDPVLHTALSDLEVLPSDEPGKLWHFRYPLASGDGHLVGRDDTRRRRCSATAPLPCIRMTSATAPGRPGSRTADRRPAHSDHRR